MTEPSDSMLKQGVLVENVIFTNGHGASIGSIPDCAGCHGHVSDVTFRNCTFGGNAPMKIKTWCVHQGLSARACETNFTSIN